VEDENTKPVEVTVKMQPEAFVRAPRVYGQSAIVSVNHEEAQMLFGQTVTLGGEQTFMLDSVVYMNLGHFRRFAKSVQAQLEMFDRMAGGSDEDGD
jgi:hypothetical protein